MNISGSDLAKRIGVVAATFLAGVLVSFESGSLDNRPHKPYRDIGGIWTVCDGITGKAVVPSRTYSDAECDLLLAEEAYRHSSGVLDCITEPISVYEQVAYSSLAYNNGIAAVCRSKTISALNAGDHRAGCAGIESFYKANDLDCRVKENGCYGVWVRRQKERAICEMRIRIPGLFDDALAEMTWRTS